ncbi:hypothetical protein BH23BAC4_BH23BAC4_11290 [soil metagenome]
MLEDRRAAARSSFVLLLMLPPTSATASETLTDGGPQYLVTARKYRPQTFDDLVAQEHVATTLRNAIVHERLAHAYIFSGPRGVGKTTAARLLAKAINCETPLAERELAEPCRRCATCTSFEEGRALSIIEIDAASNNKVEDIRDLRENVRIPPQGARYKIYILDEVHMLSSGAFNALLKTLEEPPAHALFIFATTEPHKVPATILSRCQRFDFRRIATDEIVSRLRHITTEENVTADEDSLHLIARKGDGALRDALSVFDQAVSLCGDTIEATSLREALGVVDTDLFFDVTALARNSNRGGMLTLVDGVVGRGYDIAEFLGGLAEHLRNLLVANTTGRSDLIEATEAMRGRYVSEAKDLAEADILRMLMIVDEAEARLRTSPQPRLTLELALVKLATIERSVDLRTLIGKLERLERQSASAPAGRSEAVAEAPASQYQAPPRSNRPPPGGEPPQGSSGPGPDAPAPPPRPVGDGAPSSSQVPRPRAEVPASPATREVFPQPALRPRRPDATASVTSGDGQNGLTPQPAPAPQKSEFNDEAGRLVGAWADLTARARNEHGVYLSTQLARCRVDGLRRGQMEVAVPDPSTAAALRAEEAYLRTSLRKLIGTTAPPLHFVVRTEEESEARPDPYQTLQRLRTDHPFLKVLFDKFGGEIEWE